VAEMIRVLFNAIRVEVEGQRQMVAGFYNQRFIANFNVNSGKDIMSGFLQDVGAYNLSIPKMWSVWTDTMQFGFNNKVIRLGPETIECNEKVFLK
jgi:hypothetical protein